MQNLSEKVQLSVTFQFLCATYLRTKTQNMLNDIKSN